MATEWLKSISIVRMKLLPKQAEDVSPMIVFDIFTLTEQKDKLTLSIKVNDTFTVELKAGY